MSLYLFLISFFVSHLASTSYHLLKRSEDKKLLVTAEKILAPSRWEWDGWGREGGRESAAQQKIKIIFFLISVSRSLAWVCGRNQNSKINSYTNWTALLSPLYISSADGRWRNKTVCDTDTQRMWLECLLCSSFSASCSIKLLWTFNERQNESTKKKTMRVRANNKCLTSRT